MATESSETSELKVVRSRLFDIGVGTVAVLLIILSLLGETMSDRRREISKNIDLQDIVHREVAHETPKMISTEEAFLKMLQDEAEQNSWRLLWHLLLDVGVALIVSLIVVWAVENSNRRVIEREFERRLAEISTRTIGSVYGNDHPQEVFNIATSSIFSSVFVRDESDVRLTVFTLNSDNTALPKSARTAIDKLRQLKDKLVNPEKLVVLHVETEYTVRNVNRLPQKFTPPFKMEKYFAKLGVETCEVDSVKVNGEEMRAQCDCDGDDKNYHSCRLPAPILLAPNESVNIQFSGFAIRYQHDNEMWCTALYPTQKMTVRLKDNTGLNLFLEIQNLCAEPHATSNSHAPHQDQVSLTSKCCMLPFQSVVISWAPKGTRV